MSINNAVVMTCDACGEDYGTSTDKDGWNILKKASMFDGWKAVNACDLINDVCAKCWRDHGKDGATRMVVARLAEDMDDEEREARGIPLRLAANPG